MKKRIISKRYIQNAYTKDQQGIGLDINLEPVEDKVDKLPKEMFQILGEIISFVENTNRFEGEKNENK